MRADDVLPDHASHGDFNGMAVRKGTIAAFLANATVWSDAASSAAQRATAEAHITQALPALHAVGLFKVLEVRDPALRDWLEASWPTKPDAPPRAGPTARPSRTPGSNRTTGWRSCGR